jgi:uncharacterized membrane protein
MIQLSPIPGWNELHLLVVHFPIALLIIAPLFVLLGLPSWAPNNKVFLVSALILMALGTAFLFVALQTGKAAGRLANEAPQVKQVLEHHEDLAQTTGLLFLVLTVVFTGATACRACAATRAQPNTKHGGASVLYATGALFLVNIAHQGGRLVHELGVRATVRPSSQTAALEVASEH